MNYFCLPKIYQKYMPVLVYSAILYWLMISVWFGEIRAIASSTCATVQHFIDVHVIVQCVWWQHNQFILVSVIPLIQVWDHTLVETHTHTQKNTHMPTLKHTQHQYGALCHSFHSAEIEWTGLFSPFSAHGQPQCLHESCVCVGGCEFLICRRSDLSALYLHMRTMWLTAMPYLFS